MIRVLVVSAETWRSDTNGGNVLSNIFKDFEAEFAQIYCNTGAPRNALCQHYFQMTDASVIDNLLQRKPPGRRFAQASASEPQEVSHAATSVPRFLVVLKQWNLASISLIKDTVWLLSRWKNRDLEAFVRDFKPDVIFAPCYGSHFMLALTRHVAKLTGKPVVSYISDDHHSLRHFSFSPVFWLNRLLLRFNLTRTARHYQLLYTMTEEQKRECEEFMACQVKILRKSAPVDGLPAVKVINQPIRLIFAGGLYVGRLDTLLAVASAVQIINHQSRLFELHVYSGYVPTAKEAAVLDDGQNTFYHGLIAPDLLPQKYHDSDIALHLESFSRGNRLKTRLSFSTKITECLSSGCAVMVVSWSEHAGFKYLQRHKAAICVDACDKLLPMLQQIAQAPDELLNYRQRALDLCRELHDEKKISVALANDFQSVMQVPSV